MSRSAGLFLPVLSLSAAGRARQVEELLYETDAAGLPNRVNGAPPLSLSLPLALLVFYPFNSTLCYALALTVFQLISIYFVFPPLSRKKWLKDGGMDADAGGRREREREQASAWASTAATPWRRSSTSSCAPRQTERARAREQARVRERCGEVSE
jgi:hypothetical protein